MRLPKSTTLLLVINVFFTTASYLFLPLMVLELLARGLSKAQAGSIAGVMLGTGSLCAVILGQLGARLGGKWLAVCGALLRAAGLTVFLFSPPYALYLLGAAATSLGANATILGMKSELLRHSHSRRMITLRLLAANTGALLGPAIGGLLILVMPFAHLIAITIGIYGALTLLLCFFPFKPAESKTGNHHRTSLVQTLREIDRPFAALLASVFAFSLVMAHWSLTLPVFASAAFGHQAAAAWMIALNGLLIICLQYLALTRWLAHLPTARIIRDGFLLFALAFVFLFFPPGIAGVVLFTVLLTAGEILVMPSLDEITTTLRADNITRALGLCGTVGGLGILVGASLGGWIMEHFGLPGMGILGCVAVLFALASLPMLVNASKKPQE